jgi:predicted HicB family RNase H-like nuclease
MSKLTLSVDEEVVSRAKRYAKRQGTSLSAMVEAYLASVSEAADPASKEPPVLDPCAAL